MTLQNVYSYLRDLDRSSFEVVACQGNEPSESDVAAFERTVGFALPDDFRELTMSSLGGLFVQVREEVWPRAQAGDVGPFWSFLYAVKVFGIAVDIPEWLDIRVQFDELRAEGHGDYVPFLQVEGDANKYCFDRAGAIFLWDHETDEFESVESTFPQLLLRELQELEARKNRKVAGEGKR